MTMFDLLHLRHFDTTYSPYNISGSLLVSKIIPKVPKVGEKRSPNWTYFVLLRISGVLRRILTLTEQIFDVLRNRVWQFSTLL